MILEKIIKTCLQYKIENYSINSDGSIDVDGNVDLSSRNLTILPVRFRRVIGNFNIHNNLLTTLYGAPIAVGGNFNCFNNHLISLLGAPKWVGGDFYCYQNQLRSLGGSPEEVVGSYYISGNENLENLKGCSVKIGGNFSFDDILLSTYFGDVEIEFDGNFFLNETNYNAPNTRKLPDVLLRNMRHIKLILKYQRYFYMWNDDLSFNRENFDILIEEIEDGLR
ncbi:hypothetical protein ACFX5D_04620 [Flavobacterium sp. LB3P45]|uniref:Uncharacterized protein n=1 Tax=Flavobacterium fructosi TaxID=3230416 RepID=A0ABW6HJP7_9FLAO